ncbi:serine hydrolase domain-containing protein [candidate division KSB1 bacterium]
MFLQFKKDAIISDLKISAVFLSLLLVLIFACSTGSDQIVTVFPGETWERIADPESAGFTQAGLDTIEEYLTTLNTTGCVVAVDGKLLYEYGNITELSYIASVRKSVLAMLFGNYVENGTVDMSKTLVDLDINDIGGLSEQEREATITDLISARSGVYHPASNGGDNLADAPERNSQIHGEYFLYSNWDFNTLGFIFEQETGKDIYDAVGTDLAIPVGMQDWDREAQRKSGNLEISKYPAYHMWYSTRDMARIGLLMLNKGNWNGQQVIPKDWAEKISSVITPLEEMNPERTRNGKLGYGYLWWIFDGPEISGYYAGAYTGIGAYGQYITVVPQLNMVIAHKVNNRSSRGSVSRDEFFGLMDKIFAAKKSE